MLADRKRVAEAWLEALQALRSPGPNDDARDVEGQAVLVFGHASQILAALSLASVRVNSKTGRWLEGCGSGAIELIASACESVFLSRVSGDNHEVDGESGCLVEAEGILEDREDSMKTALEEGGLLPAADYDKRRALADAINPLVTPARDALSDRELEIRDSFLALQGSSATTGEAWGDTKAAWVDYATTLLPDLVGSKESGDGRWLAGLASLVCFSRGEVSTFAAGLEALLPDQSSKPSKGKTEEEGQELSSLPGAEKLVDNIERLRNFNKTGDARTDRELLRRSIPLSVVITSAAPLTAGPKTGASFYAEALATLGMADPPQKLEQSSGVRELVGNLISGTPISGSYLVDLQHLIEALGADVKLEAKASSGGVEVNRLGLIDSAKLNAFVNALHDARETVNLTLFDREAKAESFLHRFPETRKAIPIDLALRGLEEDQIAERVVAAFEAAEYSIDTTEASVIARSITESDRQQAQLDELLEILVDKVTLEHGNRVGAESESLGQTGSLKQVEASDVGPVVRQSAIDPTAAEACLAELDQLIGLGGVKDEARRIADFVKVGELSRSYGLESGPMNVNFLFLGNPGTGKTTVARMMARLLAAIGAIPTGRLVEKTPGELKGDFLGQAGVNTRNAVKEALGGVLFIDDAYALVRSDSPGDQDSYGLAVLDELTNLMTKYPNDLVVILAGYEAQMDLVLDANPGLRRRFPFQFLFEDYLPEQLEEIFMKMARDRGLTVDDDVRQAVSDELARQSRESQDFGNAGGVEKLLVQGILARQRERIMDQVRAGVDPDRESLTTILVEDVRSGQTSSSPVSSSGAGESEARTDDDQQKATEEVADLQKRFEEAMEKLDQLVGLDEVKMRIREIAAQIRHRRLLEESGVLSKGSSGAGGGHHMVLTGNPGTGKTTVAELLAEILVSLGIVRDPRVTKTSGAGMTGEYLGQTKKKVRDLFRQSRGRVLFIDEAYGISSGARSARGGSYGDEAVTEMVMQMDELRKQVVVVAAGYPEPMEDFLDMNPGLRGRFNYFIEFPDYSDDELVEIAVLIADGQGFKFTNAAKERVRTFLAESKSAIANFANGRAARQLVDECLRAQATRLGQKLLTPEAGSEEALGSSPDVMTKIEVEDVESAELRLRGEGKISDEALRELLEETSRRLDKDLELPPTIQRLLEGTLQRVAGQAAGEKSRDSAIDLIVISPEADRVESLARVLARFLRGVRKLLSDEVVELRAVDFLGADRAATKKAVEDSLNSAVGATLVVHDAHLLDEEALLQISTKLSRKDLISVVLRVPDQTSLTTLRKRDPSIETEVEEILNLELLDETSEVRVDV